MHEMSYVVDVRSTMETFNALRHHDNVMLDSATILYQLYVVLILLILIFNNMITCKALPNSTTVQCKSYPT